MEGWPEFADVWAEEAAEVLEDPTIGDIKEIRRSANKLDKTDFIRGLRLATIGNKEREMVWLDHLPFEF